MARLPSACFCVRLSANVASATFPREGREEMAKFKKAETVRLKSGGPLMTVSDPNIPSNDGSVLFIECTWFERGKRFDSHFDEDLLVSDEGTPATA
ncbi:DUF2158 domain-containing protein [Mesorhizobium sp. CO1-1-7]|uniref:YodC family protein n=1 Tax=Mesorhizobium sp. CO1-1-7 TaxID=2876632 RepID=UPI001CD0E2C1|nr:DUF2158 domain-containing protein [Mesorhizobium sp. CO1-1-7]MBZ9748295.1 DUF2158 domain-containing protein [Mesorhizobium sp. CO1-1-7]